MATSESTINIKKVITLNEAGDRSITDSVIKAIEYLISTGGKGSEQVLLNISISIANVPNESHKFKNISVMKNDYELITTPNTSACDTQFPSNTNSSEIDEAEETEANKSLRSHDGESNSSRTIVEDNPKNNHLKINFPNTIQQARENELNSSRTVVEDDPKNHHLRINFPNAIQHTRDNESNSSLTLMDNPERLQVAIHVDAVQVLKNSLLKWLEQRKMGLLELPERIKMAQGRRKSLEDKRKLRKANKAKKRPNSSNDSKNVTASSSKRNKNN